MKRQARDREKIFWIHRVFDKRLVFRICQEPLQLNKKTNNPNKRWAKNVNRLFTKEEMMANRLTEKMFNVISYQGDAN